MRRWVRRQLAISWIVAIAAIAGAIALDERLVLYSRYWGILFGVAAVALCGSSVLAVLLTEGGRSITGLPGLVVGLVAFVAAGLGSPAAGLSGESSGGVRIISETVVDGPNATQVVVRKLQVWTDPACNYVEVFTGRGLWRRHREYPSCWPDKVTFEFAGSSVVVHNCRGEDRTVQIDRSKPAFDPDLDNCWVPR